MRKKIVKILALFIILQCAYVVLLLGINSIPKALIEKQVIETVDILDEEGTFPLGKYASEYICKWDNYTTAITYGLMWCVDNSDIVGSSIKNIYPNGAGNPIESLDKYVSGENMQCALYTRYWGGSVIFLRPLSIFGNISEIRILFVGVYLILSIICIILLIKRLSIMDAYIYVVLSILGCFWTNVMCPTYSQEIFIIVISEIAICVLFKTKEDYKEKEFLFWFTIGSITMFLTWLSYPLATFGVPICLYLKSKSTYIGNFKESIGTLIKSGIGYGLGYMSTMIAKGRINRIIGVDDTAGNRIVELIGKQSIAERFEIIGINLHRFDSNFFRVGFCISVLFILIYTLMRKNFYLHISIKAVFPLLLVGILPLAWWFIVAEHAYVHGIEAELFIISVGAILYIFREIITREKSMLDNETVGGNVEYNFRNV